MIRLETSKGSEVSNIQETDVSSFERNWAANLPKTFPRIKQRTDISPRYNCHGLTFASRRTRIVDVGAVNQILLDDAWLEVAPQDALPGDIVLYFDDDGDLNHSGVFIRTNELKVPEICSKWGSAGEYVHLLNDCPTIYGPRTRFYRCRL